MNKIRIVQNAGLLFQDILETLKSGVFSKTFLLFFSISLIIEFHFINKHFSTQILKQTNKNL